jgi:asparagine synthase (glutamine-hydrolysing)
LARHAMGIGSDRERTPYLEVLKLPPGHSLLTVAGAAPRLRRYHVFDAGCEPAFRRDAVWLEAYREAWREAVACRLPVSANIGAHHSGGLDSGTITAEIARSLGADIHRLYGFSHCHYQIEPELVMLTAMRYRMPYNLLVSGISALNEDAMTRELLASGHPNDYYYPRSMYCFHDEAKAKGVAVMFSGVGGDEGVTSFAGEAYAELAAQRDWRALSAIIPGPPVRRAVRMARFLWRNRKAPSQAIDPFWAERWAYHILDDGLVADIGLQERYRQQGLSYTCGQTTVNRQTIAKLEAPFLACRLEALAQFGASYGLDYAFPLLDVRLLRLWLSAPLVWKRGPDAMPRYLHRCANQGVFPEELLWRRGKDLGMSPYEQPRSQARNAANARLLLETAEASPSVLAEVFDAKKIRRLADRVIKGGEADLMLVDFIGQHQMILMSVNHWLRNDSESG